MAKELRYYVDLRSGCVAVRDRTLDESGYPGLHEDVPGVVKYWHGEPINTKCPTCGHIRDAGYVVPDATVKEAIALCDSLNGGVTP